MAINKNHTVEELDGIKCAIVEADASEDRAMFLKDLLELNGYQVVVAQKKATVPEGQAEPAATFSIGVTDLSYNTINAIFGRLLRDRAGRVVTLGYWQQKTAVPDDSLPYFGRVSFDRGKE